MTRPGVGPADRDPRSDRVGRSRPDGPVPPDGVAELAGGASSTRRAELAEQLDQLAHSLRNERDLRLEAWPSPGVTMWQTMVEDVNAVMAQIDEVRRMVDQAREAGADTDGGTDSGVTDAAANVESKLGKARRSIRAALRALEIPARDADPETQSELHAKAIATLGGVANYCEALAIILRGESHLPVSEDISTSPRPNQTLR